MTLFLFTKLKRVFNKLSCTSTITPEKIDVKGKEKQSDSEIYQNLLLICNAIDEIRKTKPDHSTPPEWRELTTNILFYNNNYKFNKDYATMTQYLEESLPQIKAVQIYYNQYTTPEFNNIKQAINKLIVTIEKELSKLKKHKLK